MNPLIPLFVVTPLAGAFLIMIIGRFIVEFNKYLTSVVLLFLACISFYFLFSTGDKIFVYKVGGWEPVNGIPIGIYMVMDGFTAIIVCIVNLIGFLSAFYSISYLIDEYFFSCREKKIETYAGEKKKHKRGEVFIKIFDEPSDNHYHESSGQRYNNK